MGGGEQGIHPALIQAQDPESGTAWPQEGCSAQAQADSPQGQARSRRRAPRTSRGCS